MTMDYINKLNDGKPLSKVFTLSRKTPYRDLHIVSAKKKEALLHYSEEKIEFLSEWFDHIEDFENFIYTKVYLGEKYNYIYPTGKLISPYWSDEMSKMGQTLWPISFNGKYNFIKDDGNLLFGDYFDGLWEDLGGSNSLVIRRPSNNTYSRGNYYDRLTSDGNTHSLGNNIKYDSKPVVDLYSFKSKLSERLFIHRRLFLLSIEDSDGKELVSDVLDVIKHNVRPISDIEGISEGYHGSLFCVRKEMLADKEELLLFYEFATIHCANGYRLLCFTTDSLHPDTFEEVQILRSLYIKVRKNGVWNIIDKYGDYVSKDIWFDSIELMNNGNAIVRKGEKCNFLKCNGILLSPDWYDEILPSTGDSKYVVRCGNTYNVIDVNLRFICRNWADTTDTLPCSPKMTNVQNSIIRKTLSTTRLYDPVWVNHGGAIIECYILSYTNRTLTILCPMDDSGKVDVKVVEIRHTNGREIILTNMGPLYFNKLAQ